MRANRTNERRGVILLVVLALLTLFAIVGITFVLYADSEATAARVAREAETAQRADMEPEQALALFLGQLIYDVPDDSVGAGSGLRGHSLARTMFGFNYPAIGTPGANVMPFSGVGRLHYPSQLGQDDYTLVNYTYFSIDNFVRDPERYGTRGNPSAPQGNFYVGGNAPYTYPDLNNFFLAAVNASGQVLAPSFHRPWLFNPGTSFNDMTNANWTNAQGKYLTLRPRPQDHPGFPGPDDPTGDVKNLVGALGGNDSIWIDIGAPVMTAPDGTQYKMLVAPLIMDLDGRINLNTAGNILGNTTHVSNQGWGAWEVNLAKVLYGDGATPVEYMNLFKGLTLAAGNNLRGRYVPGTPPTPTTAGQNAVLNTYPHTYSAIDYDGQNTPGTPSSRPQPPGFGGVATSCFPTFAQGYLNGATELTNHPSLFDALRSPSNALATRVFLASDLEALLRPNSLTGQAVDAGSSTLLSDLLRLSPSNFGPSASNPRFRNLITPLSADLGQPGVSPYWYSTAGAPASPYPSAAVNPLFAPVSGAVAFPTVPALPGPLPAITNNPGATPPNLSEFGGDWRAVSAALGRIRLNQPLPPYPHMGQGLLPPYNYTPLVTWGTAYDTTNAGITTQYQAAQSARQTLANQIYRTLLAVTGVTPPTPKTPSSTDLIPRRWLAQLAVNIVDYIDEDDISTPFNFYTTQDDSTFTPPTPPTQGSDDNTVVATNIATGTNPLYWVFGTELPKVVLNEVLAQAQDTNPTAAAIAGESVKLWLELFNPMPAAATLTANSQPQDAYRVPMYMAQGAAGYSPYRISITQNLMLTGASPLLLDASANVLGKANVVAPFPQNTLDADFATAPTLMSGAAQGAPTSGPVVTGAGIDPQGFLLLSPKTLMPANTYQEPFVVAGAMPGVPATVPHIQTDSVSYTPVWTATSGTTAPFDERATGLTVLLRRLANPYLPFQGDPTQVNYNPYVTVDYIQNVPIRTNNPAPTDAAPMLSRGKRQPYAALTQLLPPAMMGTPADPTKMQTYSPVLDQTGTQLVSHVTSTFGNVNAPLTSTASYDWLVHLDRPPISPIELLHVSGFPPYMLTQQFIVPQGVAPPGGAAGDNNNSINMFRHYVPWLDFAPVPSNTLAAPWWFDPNPQVTGSGTLAAGQTHRLYRLFEFLECGDRAAGVWGTGRIPGKVNINTIWDPEILRALADANPSIGMADDTVINTVFQNLIASRTVGAGGTLSANDHPFLPLSVGLNAAGGQFPNGTNVTTDTLLRLGSAATATTLQQMLFQNPADVPAPSVMAPPYYGHPYLQTQLLSKLYNNITTRSNTFAVFVTVGFFQVTNPAASPPTLGAEIGRSEGRHVRHRMFAIVDRTNLNVFSTSFTGPAAITVTPASGPQTPQLTFGAVTGTNPFTGAPWSIGAGSTVVFEPGTDNEEVVILQAGSAGGQFQATFYRSHAMGVPVIQRGNPGPWTRYDPRLDPGVVPYYSIID